MLAGETFEQNRPGESVPFAGPQQSGQNRSINQDNASQPPEDRGAVEQGGVYNAGFPFLARDPFLGQAVRHGMNNSFQSRQFPVLAKNHFPQSPSIHRTVGSQYAGAESGDYRHFFSFNGGVTKFVHI